jgi:AcrR family transcriptional regulator
VAELDQERIAAAALAVVDERGARGFTMRAVADALGVTPMALYYHVADKSALVGLVLDAALGERPLPHPTGDWQGDLWELSRWVRESSRAHPELAKLNREHVWTPTMLRVAERWVGIWQQSGLQLEAAIQAATVSSLAIYGYVDAEAKAHEIQWPDDEMLAWLPNARLLYRSGHNPEVVFELMVRALITGLHAQFAPESAEANRPVQPGVRRREAHAER